MINIFTSTLQDNRANDKAHIISEKLKERLASLEQEELLKIKTKKPWWKKMFLINFNY